MTSAFLLLREAAQLLFELLPVTTTQRSPPKRAAYPEPDLLVTRFSRRGNVSRFVDSTTCPAEGSWRLSLP